MADAHVLALPESREISRMWVPSACGKFRYVLRRSFVGRPKAPLRLCIWLNPSTADDKKDDATIRVALGYAWRWGDGGILVLNLYDLIMTDSRALPSPEEATGPDHWEYVRRAHAGEYGSLRREAFCGWGDGADDGAARAMLGFLKSVDRVPCAIARTKQGNPGHPLRRPKGLPLVVIP